MIARAEVVQSLLDLYPAPSYLEIGVDEGTTFFGLRAARKVAVDPEFKFQIPSTSSLGDAVSFKAMTSDAYFAELRFDAPKFDVIYVDGLHTFDQVLRDLLNAADRLTSAGVIVLDDILPVSYHASLPSLSEAFRIRNHLAQVQNRPEMVNDATWMGDVYKAAFFVRSFMQGFSMATVRENHGQLVLWRQPRGASEVGGQTFLDVGALDFRDTILQRDVFNIQPLATILDMIRSRQRSTPAG